MSSAVTVLGVGSVKATSQPSGSPQTDERVGRTGSSRAAHRGYAVGWPGDVGMSRSGCSLGGVVVREGFLEEELSLHMPES